MTSAGSPCNCGGWVTGLPGAPEWPAEANNKAQSRYVRVSHPNSVNTFQCAPHPLDALFVDTNAPEQGFKDLAEHEGKEANGTELQTVSHLLQDG